MTLHVISDALNQPNVIFRPLIIIEKLINDLTPEQQVRDLCFNSSCWSSQLRVLNQGQWAREFGYDSLSNPNYYYQRHFLLNEAMEKLGEICINSNLHPSLCEFWEGIDNDKKCAFQSVFDFRRRFTNRSATLKTFFKAICSENHIVINGYSLYPGEQDFFTDHYGCDDYGRQWILTNPSGKQEEYSRLDSCDITQLYRDIFNRDTNFSNNWSTEEMLSGLSTPAERWQEFVPEYYQNEDIQNVSPTSQELKLITTKRVLASDADENRMYKAYVFYIPRTGLFYITETSIELTYLYRNTYKQKELNREGDISVPGDAKCFSREYTIGSHYFGEYRNIQDVDHWLLRWESGKMECDGGASTYRSKSTFSRIYKSLRKLGRS